MNNTLAAYGYFRGFEDALRIVANRAALAGIENGVTLLKSLAMFVVMWIGITAAANGLTADRLKSVGLKIAIVVALLVEGWYMAYIAPGIVDDMPDMVSKAVGLGGAGDLYEQFSRMEGAINTAISGAVRATSGGWFTDAVIGALVTLFAGVIGFFCTIFLGIMFLTMLFYRMALHLLMVYGAWLVVMFLYTFSAGWFIGTMGQVVSVTCGMLGVHVVYQVMIDMIDAFTRNLNTSLITLEFFAAIMAMSQMAGMVFFCAATLIVAGLTASRIGGSIVPAAGTASAMAAGNKMVAAAKDMQRAARAMQASRGLGRK